MIPKRAMGLWAYFRAAGDRLDVDPYILLAICDRESLCGKALSADGTGDHKHGLGLMQIDRRYHSKFAAELMPDGTAAWRNEERNIRYGAMLFSEALREFDGEVDAAVASYNASRERVGAALMEITHPEDPEIRADVRRRALDALTTNHNYVSDVMGRAEMFRSASLPPSTPPPPKPKEAA